MNENVEDVKVESSTTEVVAPEEKKEIVKEDVKIPTESAPKSEEKVVPYDRFKKVNDELAALKKQPVKVLDKSLDVEDYIGISAALEGLDQREKEQLAKTHKLTGQPLGEIRKDEDFILWQTAYRQKLEKEKALKPSSSQPDSQRPTSLEQKLANASMADKEKILVEAGLYRPAKSKTGRVNIGN